MSYTSSRNPLRSDRKAASSFICYKPQRHSLGSSLNRAATLNLTFSASKCSRTNYEGRSSLATDSRKVARRLDSACKLLQAYSDTYYPCPRPWPPTPPAVPPRLSFVAPLLDYCCRLCQTPPAKTGRQYISQRATVACWQRYRT